MKIDLHVHSKEYSPCGVANVDEHIKAAIAAGLDALAFSNHDRLVPKGELARLNAQYAPFRIFTGIEVSEATGEHILVIGLHDAQLERGGWAYADIYAFVRARNGYIVLNHPFRFTRQIAIDYLSFPPDAVEAYSTNILAALRPRIFDLAAQIGVPVISNSDAHVAKDIGRNYNLLDGDPTTEAELIALLKTGRLTPVELPR